MAIPKFKDMERAYGFEEVALVPGDTTINPDQADTNFTSESSPSPSLF
jgi:hypothetical protein